MTGRVLDTLRIASYNIRKAVGTDRRRHPHRVLDVIAALEADIMLLQEADRRLPPRPSALPMNDITRETGLIPVRPRHNEVSLGWHGNALLLRPEITVAGLRHLDLPGLEPRGALIADLETRLGALRAIGVHLGLLRASRRAQLSAILSELSEASGQQPTVIGGDFNERSQRVGLGRLVPQFEIVGPGKTFHARRPMAALDRIAVTPQLRVVAHGLSMHPQAAFASDHLPIWADLALDQTTARPAGANEEGAV